MRPFGAQRQPLYFVITILENPGVYPTWALAVPCAIQAVLLAWNIPGHVMYVALTSKYIRAWNYASVPPSSAACNSFQLVFITTASQDAFQAKVLRDVESLEQMVRQLMQGGIEAGMVLWWHLGLLPTTSRGWRCST